MATIDFSGTNGDTLDVVDAHFTRQSTSTNTLVRNGGVCKPDAAAHDGYYYYSNGQPDDQSSQANLSIIAASDVVYLAVEMRAAGLGYTAKFSAGTNIEIRRDNVYQTDYTSTVNHGASAATAQIRLTPTGDLVVSINGSDLTSPLNVVAGGRITGGFPGIGMGEATGLNITTLDNWTDGVAGGGGTTILMGQACL